jgi:hypothetical protein
MQPSAWARDCRLTRTRAPVHKFCSMRRGKLSIKKFTEERFLGDAWWEVDVDCRRSPLTSNAEQPDACVSVNASLSNPRSDISGYIG